MGRILLVEDEESLRDILSRYLSSQGHVCDQATNGEQGVERVRSLREGYDLILSDIHMPRMDGITFLRTVRPYVEATTPFMILTAFDEWRYAMEAIQLGACNFIQKNPFDLEAIGAAVDKALELRHVYRLRHHYKEQLEKELREKEEELRRTYDGTVIGFAAMMEGKDTSTMAHLFRVRDYCTVLAREMGMPESRLRDLQLGAMLHDIGKYRVPDAILTKPAGLTPDEWEVMRQHPAYGAEFVARIPFLAGAAEVIMHHHERYDGAGYPKRLAGEAIPLSARIFSVVDAFDAIVSKRCYKPAQTPAFALAEIRRCAGTQFDPDVVEAFARVLPRVESMLEGFDQRYREEVEALGLGRLPDRGEISRAVRDAAIGRRSN